MSEVDSTEALRIVLFCDSNVPISIELAEAALAAAAAHPALRIVAVCDATRGPVRGGIARGSTELIKCLVRGAFDPRHARRPSRGERVTLAHVARRHRVPLLRPPEGDVNEPRFVERLATEHGANGVLAMGCVAILGPRLLAALPYAVNYHNGLLPRYAGLRATRWSLYHREPVCGFTFHTMTAQIDAGTVLIQVPIEVPPDIGPFALEARKAREAERRLPELFDRMVARDPGIPQTGAGSYFGFAEWSRIMTIEDPSTIDSGDLLHRLHCFELLRITHAGRIYDVTRLRRVGRAGPRTLRTRDGVLLDIACVNFLPWALERLRRRDGAPRQAS